MLCENCGAELAFVGELDCSLFFKCGGCNTVWDYMEDNSMNEETVIDVGAILDELKRKRIAS